MPLWLVPTTALLTLLLGNTYHARNIVASVLVMIWAARIAGMFDYRSHVGLITVFFEHKMDRVFAVPRVENRQRLALRYDPRTLFQVSWYGQSVSVWGHLFNRLCVAMAGFWIGTSTRSPLPLVPNPLLNILYCASRTCSTNSMGTYHSPVTQLRE